MKLLIAGDLHFNKGHFQWLSEQQDQYDCLCLTGDFVDGQREGFDRQTQWIAAWLEGLTKPTFICSGNHDLDDAAECQWLHDLLHDSGQRPLPPIEQHFQPFHFG
jgi:predicted phosphodiesterase